MEIKVIMSDADYQRVVAAQGKRVCGSVSLIDPRSVDFHAWNVGAATPGETPRKVLRTQRARTIISPDRIRFTVLVKGDEPDPATIIFDEADTASAFVSDNMLDN